MITTILFDELKLEELEEMLVVLLEVREPSATLRSTISSIKRVIKHEQESQSTKLDNLIKRISNSGFKDAEMIGKLQSESAEIKAKATKIKDKYFDGLGNEK